MTRKSAPAPGVDAIAGEISLAKMRRHQLVEQFWNAYRWRERIRLADRGCLFHLEDCRRDLILAHFDQIVCYTRHLEDVIRRMLLIVEKQKGLKRNVWTEMIRTSHDQVKRRAITPVILYNELLEQIEMCEPKLHIEEEQGSNAGGEDECSDRNG
jgi:hypothetical protein